MIFVRGRLGAARSQATIQAPARSRRLADERVRQLASDPEALGKKLRGRLQHLRSARLGRHVRIVYGVDKPNRTVKIMATDTRGDVFKRLGG